jgi:hypothetical protein
LKRLVIASVLLVVFLLSSSELDAQQLHRDPPAMLASPVAGGPVVSQQQPIQPVGWSATAAPTGIQQAPYHQASPPALLPAPVPAVNNQQLLERVEQLESQLQNQQQQLQQATEQHNSSFIELLEDRWSRIADPEIEIINYQTASAQKEEKKKEEKKGPKKWYEKLNIRGYTQVRVNETVFEEPGSAPPQHVGDRSVQDDQSFIIRRARLILFGDVSEHMYVYLQPDFAVTPPGSTDANQFTQIRDWYADCYIDNCKVHRVRVGSSKVPYGWENLQSSSNRLPLDRSDPINSAARNERDLGVFYYYTPEWAQDFFKDVMDQGLKGSGNYGVLGFGFHNGQGGSLAEQNDNMHFVVRLALPYVLESGQHMELGVQAYTGNYVVLPSNIRRLGMGASLPPNGTLGNGGNDGILDERIGGTFVWYPEPLGFQTEWNVGRGPALNAAQNLVEERALYGGYAMMMYRHEIAKDKSIIPFVRYAYFNGGYKAERNAPYALITEWETGFEWQLNAQMEFTAMYTWTDRTNTTAFNQVGVVPYRQFEGDLLRFQFQFNY